MASGSSAPLIKQGDRVRMKDGREGEALAAADADGNIRVKSEGATVSCPVGDLQPIDDATPRNQAGQDAPAEE